MIRFPTPPMFDVLLGRGGEPVRISGWTLLPHNN